MYPFGADGLIMEIHPFTRFLTVTRKPKRVLRLI